MRYGIFEMHADANGFFLPGECIAWADTWTDVCDKLKKFYATGNYNPGDGVDLKGLEIERAPRSHAPVRIKPGQFTPDLPAEMLARRYNPKRWSE